MIKNYVLDTNVLLYDPTSINMFEDNNVYIPIVVLEELDKFKKNVNGLGVNARQIIKYLDSLREKGKLNEGVLLESGGKLFIIPVDSPPKIELNGYTDNKIIQFVLFLKDKCKIQTILVTKDINLRVKSDALGIESQDYKKPSEGDNLFYTGTGEIVVEDNIINELNSHSEVVYTNNQLTNNQYLTIKSVNNPSLFILGKFLENKLYIIDNGKKNRAANICPRNKEQTFALNALLDPEISLVALSGISGTGKTLLTIASGIQKTLVDGEYNSITVTRPTISVGKDLGFLPGGVDEKLDPWMKPIYDAIDLILYVDRKKGKTEMAVGKDPFDIINIAPLSYIRGRSFMHSFMIVDETQNLGPLEVKTIITRAGMGTKIVLTGDINQIDNPYLNIFSNGLSQLIRKFKGKKLFAHINLIKGERSELAEMASLIL